MGQRKQFAIAVTWVVCGLSACFPEEYPCSKKGAANLQLVTYDWESDSDTYEPLDESEPLLLDMVAIGGSGAGQGGFRLVQPGLPVRWAAAGVKRRATEVSITTSIPGVYETELVGERYLHVCEPEVGWTAQMGLPVETLIEPIELFGAFMTISVRGVWPNETLTTEHTAVVDPRPIYEYNDQLCYQMGQRAYHDCLDEGRDSQDCESEESEVFEECYAGFPDWEL